MKTTSLIGVAAIAVVLLCLSAAVAADSATASTGYGTEGAQQYAKRKFSFQGEAAPTATTKPTVTAAAPVNPHTKVKVEAAGLDPKVKPATTTTTTTKPDPNETTTEVKVIVPTNQGSLSAGFRDGTVRINDVAGTTPSACASVDIYTGNSDWSFNWTNNNGGTPWFCWLLMACAVGTFVACAVTAFFRSRRHGVPFFIPQSIQVAVSAAWALLFCFLITDGNGSYFAGLFTWGSSTTSCYYTPMRFYLWGGLIRALEVFGLLWRLGPNDGPMYTNSGRKMSGDESRKKSGGSINLARDYYFPANVNDEDVQNGPRWVPVVMFFATLICYESVMFVCLTALDYFSLITYLSAGLLMVITPALIFWTFFTVYNNLDPCADIVEVIVAEAESSNVAMRIPTARSMYLFNWGMGIRLGILALTMYGELGFGLLALTRMWNLRTWAILLTTCEVVNACSNILFTVFFIDILFRDPESQGPSRASAARSSKFDKESGGVRDSVSGGKSSSSRSSDASGGSNGARKRRSNIAP